MKSKQNPTANLYLYECKPSNTVFFNNDRNFGYQESLMSWHAGGRVETDFFGVLFLSDLVSAVVFFFHE